MNLALRRRGFPVSLEKWYIDALMDDGSVLLVYLVHLRLLGLPISRVTAELFRPGQPVIRGEAVARGVRGGEDALDFGPARIEGELLRFETPGLSGELRYRPRAAPVRLLDPFIQRGRRRLLWEVELPDADVSGRVWWPGGQLQLSSRGYRDRVWFDLLPWRFPIRRLVWGRAVAGPHAATWVAAETAQETVQARWEGGEVTVGDAHPPDLQPSRVILDTRVADIEGLLLGWLRPLLRFISGDPHELKRAGPADMDGSRGPAIHEVVTWGR